MSPKMTYRKRPSYSARGETPMDGGFRSIMAETADERARFYRQQAAEIRDLAAKIADPANKEELLGIARRFDRLAERALKSSY